MFKRIVKRYEEFAIDVDWTLCKVDGSKHGKQFGWSLDSKPFSSCTTLFKPVLSKLLQMVCLTLCLATIGSLSNQDDGGNENVKKQYGI